MNKLLTVFLLSFFMQVNAQEEKKIYKYTDENGVTHYTETKPTDDYEEADLPPLSVVPSEPVETGSSSQFEIKEEVDPSVVEKFELISPVKEQNLWGTGGKLTAQVSELTEAQKQKYQVQFVLNGKKQKPSDKTTQVFDNIYRGEHNVQALLVNRYTSKVVKKTDQITFFMHQNSKK